MELVQGTVSDAILNALADVILDVQVDVKVVVLDVETVQANVAVSVQLHV